jgi:hypothetical protein
MLEDTLIISFFLKKLRKYQGMPNFISKLLYGCRLMILLNKESKLNGKLRYQGLKIQPYDKLLK